MDEAKTKQILWFVIPLLIAVLSVTFVGNKFASVSTYRDTMEVLENQEKDILTLSATAAGASAAITLLPGDVGTPLADRLADISTDFMYLLAVIVLEKYLMTIAGFVSFKILIPVACVLALACKFAIQNEGLKYRIAMMTAKIAAFAVCLALVVPASAWCSKFISSTYQASMNEMIEEAKNSTDTVQDSAKKSDGDENILKNLLQKAGIGVSSLMEQFKQSLTKISRIFAYMLVSSCLIPVCVLAFFLWIIKMLFGVSIPIDRRFHGSHVLKGLRSKQKEESDER